MRKATASLSSLLLLILLPLLLTLFATPAATAASDDDGSVPNSPATVRSKDEVVYARLSGAGETLNAYVVNHFTLAGGGSFSDYGNYTSVLNQTDLQPLTLAGSQITAQTASTNFFYQGYLANQALPWFYTITYTLDKAIVPPEELAGKTGHIAIRITSAPNTDINDTFYKNYMQQITITLDTDTCRNITAKDATAANAGKNRVLTYTVMPEHDADILITVDAEDFTMSGIDITAMPFSMNMELPDTGAMIDDFSQMSQALTQLNDGVKKLKTGSAELKTGSEQLKDGSVSFNDGVSQLNTASAQLKASSQQINDALAQLSASLNGTDTSTGPDLTGLTALPAGLTQLADGLSQISSSTISLKISYNQAYSALSQAIENIPDTQINATHYAALYAAASTEEKAELDKLSATYNAAQTLKTTYTQTQATLASVTGTLQTLSDSVTATATALSNMSQLISSALADSDLTQSLQQLTDGMSALSANYVLFHQGLTAYTEGVSALSSNYSRINNGVEGMNNGIDAMHGGISNLQDGTEQLTEETRDLPNQVQNELDRITGRYTGRDFQAISFTSSRNDQNISFVQFVFKTDAIEKPSTGSQTKISEEKQSFWDRLMKLFSK